MRWALVIVIFILVEIYAFQAFKTLFKFNWISKIYVLINFSAISFLVYRLLLINYKSLSYTDLFYDYLSIPIALLMTLFGFKLIICSFLLF